jgi:serine/threonine-protein kinase
MLTCPRCGSNYTRDLEYCGIDGQRLVRTDEDPLIGRTIDRYLIKAFIGDGGMARVYRAKHVYLDQECAIKVLHGEVASDKQLARRFQREAQASSRIKHPNVVSIIDFGSSGDGLIFMAMELLFGRTLSDAIKSDAPYEPARAASLIRQLASGLDAAHALGFVHRDLKPKNVMLVEENGEEIAKILDFGLVLFTEMAPMDATMLTRQGQVFGTPAYMSPEQSMGLEVDARADLYSLGVILYQMLSARVPFVGTPAEIALQHLSMKPEALPQACGLGPMALRLMAKERERRPASAAEVVQMIDALDLVAPTSMPVETSHTSSPRLLPTLDIAFEDEPSFERLDTRFGTPRWGLFVLLALVVCIGSYAIWLLARPTAPKIVSASVSDPGPSLGPGPGPESDQARAEQAPADPAPADPAPADHAQADEPRVHKEPAARAQTLASTDDEAPTHDPDTLSSTARELLAKPRPSSAPEPRPILHRSFEQLDTQLQDQLARRGLNWRDVASNVPDKVEQWSLWRIGADRPGADELERAYLALERATSAIHIDKRLVESKLDRVQSALAAFPKTAQGSRYRALLSRFKDGKRMLDRISSPGGLVNLAGQVTRLERDVLARPDDAEETSEAAETPTVLEFDSGTAP